MAGAKHRKGKSKGKKSSKKKCSCSHSHVQTTKVSVGGGGAVAAAPSVVTYATFANPMPNATFPTWESGGGYQPVKPEHSTADAPSSGRPNRDAVHFGPFTGGGVLGGWLNDANHSVRSESMGDAMSYSHHSPGPDLNDSSLSVLDKLYLEAEGAKAMSEQGNSVAQSMDASSGILSMRSRARTPPRYGGSISSGGLTSSMGSSLKSEPWSPPMPPSNKTTTRAPNRDSGRPRTHPPTKSAQHKKGVMGQVLSGDRSRGVLFDKLASANEKAMRKDPGRKRVYETAPAPLFQGMPDVSGFPSTMVIV